MVLKGHSSRIRTCCFNGAGNLVASGSTDQTVRIWDSQNGLELACLERHRGEIEACSFSTQHCNQIAAGGEGTDVNVWDFGTNQLLTQLQGHSKRITCCKYTQQTGLLLTGSLDGTVCFWDLRNNQVVNKLDCNGGIRCCDVSDATGLMSTGGHDQVLRIWDSRSSCILRKLDFEGYVFSCCFSPSSEYIIVGIGNPDYLAHVISVNDDIALHTNLLGNVDHVSSVSWKCNVVAVGSSFHNVCIFSAIKVPG